MPHLGLFDVAVVGNACQLRVSGNIDREASGQYIIVVGVREEARRTKRQAANQQTPFGKGLKIFQQTMFQYSTGTKILICVMRNKQCSLCFVVYNTFQNATVILTIEDRNDNAPQFIYPHYPGQLLNRNLYVGAISINAPAGSNVLSVHVSLPNVTIKCSPTFFQIACFLKKTSDCV